MKIDQMRNSLCTYARRRGSIAQNDVKIVGAHDDPSKTSMKETYFKMSNASILDTNSKSNALGMGEKKWNDRQLLPLLNREMMDGGKRN